MIRKIYIDGKLTSIHVDAELWAGLMEICEREQLALEELCLRLPPHKDLAAALVDYVTTYFRTATDKSIHKGFSEDDENLASPFEQGLAATHESDDE